LGHGKGDGAHAGGDGFGFEAVGMALARGGAFVRLGLEDLGAFQAHGFIDEQADALGKAGPLTHGKKTPEGTE
jgi:hypothetical protein